MDLQSYLKLDATAMAHLIKKKEVTPKELVNLSFEQLEKVNPTLNSITNHRKEKVLKESESIIEEEGPFLGVPILLKNISQALKDEPLTSGSKLLKDETANEDSNLVLKMREAGFLFLGHTNTPEFALKNITEPELYGATRNPWDPNYSSGGSSGGSATAIASGIVPLAGASDGGGSIRIPASFTSLVGLKPTRGRTPVGPGVGRQWQGASIDFVLSRTVRDSAAMLDLLQVNQPEAAFQTALYPGSYQLGAHEAFERPLRIAFTTKSPVGTLVSKEAREAVEQTVKWLEQQGHHVEEKDNDVDGMQLMRNYFLMNSGEMSGLVQQLENGFGRNLKADDMEIESWILNQAGKTVSAADFSASLSSWDVAAAEMVRFHEVYDLYITPTTANTAPQIRELTHTKAQQDKLISQIDHLSSKKQQELIYDMFLPSLTYSPFTQLANLTGQPALSVPVYLSAKGLPLGVQIMASKGEEYKLLKLAYQLENSPLWVGMKGNPYFK